METSAARAPEELRRSKRVNRRLWFFGLWLLLPWPFVLFGEAFVPAVRFVILAGAASAVALTEGAAGPVGMIIGLFVGYAIGTTLLCWLFAWLISLALAPLPETTARRLTLACLVAGLVFALLFDPYTTPFGRASRGGLLEVLS